ncbi:hypothetical protein BC332_34442 [Capsicum chinense]|nr:hypothetical protein BC332_34442 [Capsicum chinense]
MSEDHLDMLIAAGDTPESEVKKKRFSLFRSTAGERNKHTVRAESKSGKVSTKNESASNCEAECKTECSIEGEEVTMQQIRAMKQKKKKTTINSCDFDASSNKVSRGVKLFSMGWGRSTTSFPSLRTSRLRVAMVNDYVIKRFDRTYYIAHELLHSTPNFGKNYITVQVSGGVKLISIGWGKSTTGFPSLRTSCLHVAAVNLLLRTSRIDENLVAICIAANVYLTFNAAKYLYSCSEVEF